MSEPLRALVTGRAGFIGSHIVDLLVKNGYNVRVVDNLSTAIPANIHERLMGDRINFIEGGIRDFDTAKNCLPNVDILVHLAAVVSVSLLFRKPASTYETNVTGTLNLLKPI